MSICTSEEQVTLHIDNCIGCPLFLRSQGISLVPYTHLSYDMSRAGEIQNISNELSLMKSLASDTSQVKSLVKI